MEAGPVLPSAAKTLASGVKARVFAACSRRVTSTEAKVFYVPALPTCWGLRIKRRVRPTIRFARILIIRYAIIRPIVRDGL